MLLFSDVAPVLLCFFIHLSAPLIVLMPPVLYSEYSSVWLVPSCVLVPPFAVCINSDSLSYCNLTTSHLAAATIGFNQSEYTFVEGDTVVDIVVRVLEGELGTLYTVALDLVPRTASGEQYEYLVYHM